MNGLSTRLSNPRGRLFAMLNHYRSFPNPLLLRELRQSTRLTRTPVILATLTALVALIIASIGGLASAWSEPTEVGVALFQTFFSIAFALVAWIGPAVAASTIAGERSAQTWELLKLTGMRPTQIARGKFLAALAYVFLYIVMLAPVGALSFLFGGVTALEVCSALIMLCIFTILWVAFGLSISSKLTSPAAAIVVSLLTAVPLSIAMYLGLGFGGSSIAHEHWPSVPSPLPVWLPTAYARLPMSVDVLVLLVLSPLALALIPAWFFHEITVANLSSISDDRSTGLRRWLIVSSPALALVLALPSTQVGEPIPLVVSAILCFELFLTSMAFVFAAEPLGPGRRVRLVWEQTKLSRIRRTLGPGIMKAAAYIVAIGLLGLGVQWGVFHHSMAGKSHLGFAHAREALHLTLLHAVCLTVFSTGLMAWLRSRSKSALVPRLLLAAALLLITVGPWVLRGVAGWAWENPATELLAAPSPGYIFVMLEQLSHPSSSWNWSPSRLLAGKASLVALGAIGLALLGFASRRVRGVTTTHSQHLAELEAALKPSPAVNEPDSGAARGNRG